MLCGLATAATADPPAARWQFNTIGPHSAIADTTGSGHDGIVVRSEGIEGPFAPRLEPGIEGQALRCGGSRQYGYFMDVPRSPISDGPFTVAAWVKPTTSQWITRILYFKPGWLRRSGFEVLMSGDRVQLVLCPEGARKETRKTVASSVAIQPGYWCFVALTWDGQTWRLYMNGLQVGTENDPGLAYAPPPDDVPLKVGGYSVHTNNTFCGLVDDVQVWTHALGEDELRQALLEQLR
jgi:hypothetical protein